MALLVSVGDLAQLLLFLFGQMLEKSGQVFAAHIAPLLAEPGGKPRAGDRLQPLMDDLGLVVQRVLGFDFVATSLGERCLASESISASETLGNFSPDQCRQALNCRILSWPAGSTRGERLAVPMRRPVFRQLGLMRGRVCLDPIGQHLPRRRLSGASHPRA